MLLVMLVVRYKLFEELRVLVLAMLVFIVDFLVALDLVVQLRGNLV